MIPLVGDFAPPERRGSQLSIVVSGLMSGMLIARFLSGVVSNFTSWRNIYWFACGAQFLLSLCLYLFMPDYPSKNPDGLNYFRALWSIPCIMVQEPLLIQACLMVLAMSCVFTTFWTTLTFLLSSEPYEYSTLTIGLFSLLTLPAIIGVPLFGRMIDRFVPHLSILIGELIVGAGLVVGTFTSDLTVAGPIIQGVCIDLGVQIVQVANRSAIFSIRPKARNRVNTAYMATAFIGQLTGTAVGNRLYAMGGWRASGGCSSMFPDFLPSLKWLQVNESKKELTCSSWILRLCPHLSDRARASRDAVGGLERRVAVPEGRASSMKEVMNEVDVR